jgi:hypothetical protein
MSKKKIESARALKKAHNTDSGRDVTALLIAQNAIRASFFTNVLLTK